MKKNKKIKLFKIFAFPLVISITSVPISSCSYNKNLEYKPNQTPPKDLNETENNLGSKEILDNEIASSKEIKSNVELQELNSHEYGLKQNYLDFLDNSDFSKNETTKDLLIKDLLGYLNTLFFENNKSISITKASLKKWIDDGTNNNLILGKNKISFTLNTVISSKSLTNFVIENNSFSLTKDFEYNLEIEVVDQVIKPTIEKYNNKFYLGWKVDQAIFSFNNKSFTKEFLPTKNSFSQAFYITYNNLSNKDTYFDLKNKYEKEFGETVNQENIKNLVEQKVNNEMSMYFYGADAINNLLIEIKNEQPINKLIEKSSNYLFNLISKLGIIPNEFSEILKQVLYIDSDAVTNNSKNLIDIIYENKNKILSLLKSYLGSGYDVVAPLIQHIEPNMKEDNESYRLILEYLDKYLKNDKQLKTIITSDILGVTGTPKNFWSLIWDNFDFLISKIKGFVSNNSTLNSLIDLISLMFTKNDKKEFISIYDSIFASDENKTKFANALIKLLPTSLSNYVSIFINNNPSFTKDNLKALISSVSDLINKMFTYKKDMDINKPYYERYENLIFTRDWITTPKLNKKDSNMLVSFEYKVAFKINTKIDVNLSFVKSLISQNSFDLIIEQLTKINKDSLVKMINEKVSQTQVAGQKVSLETDASTMINNEFEKIKNYFFDFLPNVISLGADENLLSFNFKATNQEVWFDPSFNTKDSSYYLGFSVGYDLSIFYDDPAMINSIAKNFSVNNVTGQSSYKVKVLSFSIKALYFDYTINYYNFWKPILENVLLKNYIIPSRFYLSDHKNKIADKSTYDENYYYTNLTFTNKADSVSVSEIDKLFDKSKSENIETVNSNISLKDKNKNDVTWKDKTEKITGTNVITTDKNKSETLSKIFDINTNNKSLINLKLINNYDYNFNSLVNLTSELSFKLIARGEVDILFYKWKEEFKNISFNLKLNVSSYYTNIYFPVKFYDISNKKLIQNWEKRYNNIIANTNGI